jgi:hypothetical protein
MKKHITNWNAGLAGILILIFILFTACSGNQDKQNADKKDSTATSAPGSADKPADARYGMKSGKIVYKSTTMMMNQDIIIYFDDWGKKQRSEITMELLGQKVNNVTIIDSASVYNIDMTKKTGTIIPMDTTSPDHINFLTIPEETKKKFNITEAGEEEVIGRKCKVYSMSDKVTGLSGKYYIWNGIPLKTVAKMMGIEVKMEATELVENAVIPAEKFVVPAGIKFKKGDPRSMTGE